MTQTPQAAGQNTKRAPALIRGTVAEYQQRVRLRGGGAPLVVRQARRIELSSRS